MNYLIVAIATLIGYSLMSTIIYFITKENDDVAMFFGLGIVGELLIGFCYIIRKLIKWNKYHNKRSIIKITDTGEKRYCKLKDTNDIYGWFEGYELVKRYATKMEWSNLNTFDKEEVRKFKRNCDHCIHDRKECRADGNALCDSKLNYFDRFESK